MEEETKHDGFTYIWNQAAQTVTDPRRRVWQCSIVTRMQRKIIMSGIFESPTCQRIETHKH